MKGRKLVGALLLVVAAGVAAAGAGVWRLRKGSGLPEGSGSVSGLAAPAEVLWDSLGVPHVWAASLADALFVQGWVHAHQRLWQMEMFRRVAEGRLSELFGDATLDADRFLRTLGLFRAAAATEAALDGETLALLEAYVRGVNGALAAWEGPLPPEFVILRVRPGPWTVRHVLSVEKIMAWDLAEYEQGLTEAEALRRLGREGYEVVRSRYPEWGVTIVEGEAPRARETRRPSRKPPDFDGTPLASARVPEAARRLLDLGSVSRASNSWVVGGERSRSGKPLLANDMHLGLDAPTIFHLVGLHAPGLDVVGMGLAGTPGVVAGHTPAVAWGYTNAMVDDTDFFVERIDPTDSARYLTPEGSEPFRVREEVIRVRGREIPETLVVRETRHGPVMTQVEARAGGEVMALRWSAHDPSTTAEAILGMNRARSVGELLDALRLFSNPHQNVVFADTAGRYGYWMAGRVPLRRNGRPSLLPVPGWTGESDWIGHLPFEDHPHVLDPASGVVVTANHRQSRSDVGDLIADGSWARPYRAMRIQQLLDAEPLHDAATLHRIQMDVGSAFVDRYKASAVAAFRAGGLAGAADGVSAWDGRATTRSREAVLFFSWIQALRKRLRKDLYGGEDGYYPLSALERALDHGTVPERVLAEAATEAAAVSRGLTWGDANHLELDHPLGSVPVVGRLMGFGRRRIPREGSSHSPNVSPFSGDSPPFTVRAGPSQRHVVDLADPDGSGGFILPGGQSGVPGSPHAFDQLPAWLSGGLVPLPLDRKAVEARSIARLELRPAHERPGLDG